jgi:hypothetical protein
MLSACTAVLLAASVTFTVKFDVPAIVGVPVIAPVDVFRLSPAGSVPAERLQEYGVVPPVAASDVLYADCACPLGRLVVEMLNDDVWAGTDSVNACVANWGI